METKEETTAPAVGGMTVKQNLVFTISDEELKAFYLKEAVLLMPTYCTPNRSEFQLLCILKREYKKILDFLNQLNSYPWQSGIVNLHEVCIPYALQGHIALKERKSVCDEISAHLHFLTSLVGNQHVSKELYRCYTLHYSNLKRILNLYYPMEEPQG